MRIIYLKLTKNEKPAKFLDFHSLHMMKTLIEFLEKCLRNRADRYNPVLLNRCSEYNVVLSVT